MGAREGGTVPAGEVADDPEELKGGGTGTAEERSQTVLAGAGGGTPAAPEQGNSEPGVSEAPSGPASGPDGVEGSGAQAAVAVGPDSSRASKCADACFERGTCNEATGECFCVAGYSGADCSQLAFPSCQLAAGYSTPCSFQTSCECLVECQALVMPISNACHRGTLPDGTKNPNLTQIFDGPMYSPLWDKTGSSILPPTYRNPYPVDVAMRDASPELCPKMCSGHGMCERATRICQCPWASGGEACEIPLVSGKFPTKCNNECSGKGECAYGTCQCQRGFFGMDCSLFLDQDGNARILPRHPYKWTTAVPPVPGPGSASLRPRVFVYDLPGYFNTWQGLHSFMLDYMEPVWFIERMHNSPFRTPDPEEADFFFLPLIIRNREGNHENIVTFTVNYVRKKWPYWDRKGGRDHFVLTNGDWGSCEIGREYGVRSPALNELFTVTNWGHSLNMHLEEKGRCFEPGRDIAMAYAQHPSNYRFSVYMQETDTPVDEDRNILLYFRGFSAEAVPAFGRGKYTWSFGVRQEFYRLYEGRFNETGILIDKMTGGPGMPRHLEMMRKSVFCLGPAGWGWGNRATQALLMGCIPVIIQPNVVQPYEGDGLDWADFSVRLEKSDIPRVGDVLRAIPRAEIQAKRRKMEDIFYRFIWSSYSFNPLWHLSKEEQDKRASRLFDSDAFFGVMRALQLRLQR